MGKIIVSKCGKRNEDLKKKQPFPGKVGKKEPDKKKENVSHDSRIIGGVSTENKKDSSEVNDVY